MLKCFKPPTFNYAQFILTQTLTQMYSHSCQITGYELHNELIPLSQM